MSNHALMWAWLGYGSAHARRLKASTQSFFAEDHDPPKLVGANSSLDRQVAAKGISRGLTAFVALVLAFNPCPELNPVGMRKCLSERDPKPEGSHLVASCSSRRLCQCSRVSMTNKAILSTDRVASLAGTPELLPELRALNAAGVSALDTLPHAFPFPLDNFQLDVLRALDDKRSVVVSAPTGSGKTVCGELGIYLALARGQRVIYTTPLKALSNQKFFDLKLQFGVERVGLLTGDTNINREGSVLVMTTEVYRNMLLKSEADVYTEEQRVNETDYDPLVDVGVVVLDEFHYMNDPYRGTIWEECCIFASSSVQIIALSATIRNAIQIVEWLEKIHGETSLVSTNLRPIPLQYHYLDNLGLVQFYTQNDAGPGGKPKEPTSVGGRKKQWKLNKWLTPDGRIKREIQVKSRPPERLGGGRGAQPIEIAEEYYRPDPPRQQVPSMNFLVKGLRKRNMLPAIVFIFSRKGCDEAAERAASQSGRLLTKDEELEVSRRVSAFEAANSELGLDQDRLDWLRKGVGSHHAGLLPLEKSFIETLFQDLLVKVVFATETLAAGINMPARCTVLTKITKRGDEGIVPLTASSVLQMAGRAGRRGKDDMGYVVLCRSPSDDASSAYKVLAQLPEPITSHFVVTYGLAVQMLRMWSVEECKNLLERSFGSFLAEMRATSEGNRLIEMDDQLSEERELLQGYAPEDIQEYRRMHDKWMKAIRNVAFLKETTERQAIDSMEILLPFVPLGTVMRLADGSCGVLLEEPPLELMVKFNLFGKAEHFLLLMRSNHDKVEEDDDNGYASDGVKSAAASELSLRVVEPRHVVAFNQNPQPPPREPLMTLLENLPPPDSWVLALDGSISAELQEVELGGEVTAGAEGSMIEKESSQAVNALQSATTISSLILPVPPPEPNPALLKASASVTSFQDQVSAMPLHSDPEKENVIDAYLNFKELTDSYNKLSKKVKRQRELGENDASVTWKKFESTCEVLQNYGALDDTWAPTAFGNLVGDLASQNELWVALVLVELSNNDRLTAPELAGVLTAVINEGLRPNVDVFYRSSQAVLDTLDMLQDTAQKLYFEQLEHDVDFPIFATEAACPVVEAWAAGDEWENLVESTSLDAGDIVRIIRQTQDLLFRVASVPYVSRRITNLAREARRAMDRYPVSENLIQSSTEAVEVGEQEELGPIPIDFDDA